MENYRDWILKNGLENAVLQGVLSYYGAVDSWRIWLESPDGAVQVIESVPPEFIP